MQSPPLEWSIFAAHFIALDYLRARGNADHDTASECLRNLVAHTPHGQTIFTIGLVAGAIGFRRHILRPLRHT